MREAAIEKDWVKSETGSTARWLAPAGRALFSLVFIGGGLGHFARPSIEFAASQGVPLAQVLVPLSGVLALLGGLSILLGYRVKVGAALVAAFLLPVTFKMHQFWAAPDPATFQLQMAMFLKNLALLGGALLVAFFGAGPASLDHRRERS
jgi:putative oxidoreductase